jgi:cell division septation protein DedD
MNYEFALDKKALISLIAGSVLIAVLLFLAGLIVGRQWTVVVSAEAASRSTEGERAALPKEPVLNEEDVSTPNTGTPRSIKPKVTAPQEPAAATAAATQASAAATQPPASQPAGDVRIIESVTDAAAQPDEAAKEPEYVTVQVGVFLDQKEASHLLQQIEARGYAPTFFSGRDAEARQWYAVRIGVYSDKQQATNAAANFTKQEKMKAVVRPLEAL